MSGEKTGPVICLAASGGGHLRQILDLKPLWQQYPHYIVTEDTSLGRHVAKHADTQFVPHFALGQARLGSPLRMFARAWRSLWQSLAIVRRNPPDFVITTGAGSQLFVLFWARMLGAKIILIDSFARFRKPSKFARICSPLAHYRFAQSEAVIEHWPKAEVFDPLRRIALPKAQKEDLLFATVGATLPFERLTSLVRAAKQSGLIKERVVLQAGEGIAIQDETEGLVTVEEMSFENIQETLARARIVICHAGTGSIITALQNGCQTIVIPRSFERGEHYDNHQLETAQSLKNRGLVMIADDIEALGKALELARHSEPLAATTDYGPLMERLEQIITGRGNAALGQ